MATFDQLSADQRAIVELVLQRGKSYQDLAGMLDMPEARVRELAREALVQLAPVSARRVDAEWRGQLADYILGQQAGPEATATRGHLRRSEAARAWARSLLDSLDSLYEEGARPSIPEGERGRRERPRRERAAAAERRLRRPAVRPLTAVQRRRLLAGGGALALLVLLIVLVWPVGVLTGGGGNDKGSSAASANANVATCPTGIKSIRKGPAGLALIARRGGRNQLIVSASGLQPNVIKRKRPQDAYEVWLYNSRTDARAVGAQVTDRRGNYQGAGLLPADYKRFACIDVSREPLDRNQAHSGNSVLRGRLRPFRVPPPNVAGNKPLLLERIVLTTPPK
jgi:hypothetical protein